MMSIDMQSKTLYRLYKVAGCFFIWIAYTYMIIQLLKRNTKTPDAKKLDLAQETYETDQRASICFKEVIPFSIPLIQGSQICQKKPDLLIMIHTEADNIDVRNAYREEFSNRIKNTSAKYDFQVDIVYLIGLNQRYCILAKTIEEIVTHKDILVGSFIDTYYNQTLKSITMLEWFTKYCKSATVLLKLDGRMDPAKSLDSDTFYSLIRNVRNKDKLILGSVNDVEVTSMQHIPWISLPYLYPGLPQNLHLNYLLSRDSAESLLKAYTDTIYISVWKEDLYITGILANIAKLRIIHNGNFLAKCDAAMCTFCTCASSRSSQDKEFADTIVSSTFATIDLVTSDKLVHSIPKRDTQAAFQMYSSQTVTIGTYPSTDHTEEWRTSTADTTNTATELKIEHTLSTDVTPYTILDRNVGTTPLQDTDSTTSTPPTTANTDTATELETEHTLSTDVSTHTILDENTGTSLQDTYSTTSTPPATTNTDFTTHTRSILGDATSATPATLSTMETTTVTNGEVSSVTEIIDAVLLTDIPTLQIDEFELGFQAASQDKSSQKLDTTGVYSTWNVTEVKLSTNETTTLNTLSENNTSSTEGNFENTRLTVSTWGNTGTVTIENKFTTLSPHSTITNGEDTGEISTSDKATEYFSTLASTDDTTKFEETPHSMFSTENY